MKLIVIILTFSTTLTFAQSTTSKEIDSIYNFKPSKLTDKQKESKFPALDKFWGKVKSDTSKYLSQLRFELKQTGHNPFFYYDGSALLLSLSATKSDKELAIQAIIKCDLDDISREIYVTTLNRLARDGIDVTAAAVKILHDDKYSFFLPQHAMSFNQGYCLTYMLLPQANNDYVDTLISKFFTLNATAQKSIITTLWFSYSCKGDSLLKSVITDEKVGKETREYTKKLMRISKLTKDEIQYLKMVGKEHLPGVREHALQRFSDEAIDELDLTTRVLRIEKNCH